MEVITASRLLDVFDISPGWTIGGLAAGPDHEPLVYLYDTSNTQETLDQQVACRMRILRHASDSWESVDLQDVHPWHHHVQPLPHWAWLVVGDFSTVRRHSRASPPDDARVYGPDGLPRRSFYAGKCITQVQATSEGLIWYGYGDEGVFSDRLASQGLACRDLDGRTVFGYLDHLRERVYSNPAVTEEEQRRHSMTDCSALNVVSEDEVWACYWGGLHGDPIVRLDRQGIQRIWLDNPIMGRSMAIAGRRALFGGIYKLDDRLLLVALDTSEVVELLPVDENRRPILRTKQWYNRFGDGPYDVPAYRTAARGSKFYILTDEGRLHLVDLRSISGVFTEASDDISLDAIERRIECAPSVLALRGIIGATVRGWSGNPRGRELLLRCMRRAKALGDDENAVDSAVIEALARRWHDDETVCLLQEWAAPQSETDRRSTAVGAIVRHFPGDERFLALLLNLAGCDPDSRVRYIALLALVDHWADEPSVFPMVRDRLLSTSDHRDKLSAVWLLGRGWPGDPRVRHLLLNSLADPDQAVRRWVISKLEDLWLDDAEVVAALEDKGLHDPSSLVRAEALAALSRLPTKLSLVAERAVNDPDAAPRGSTFEAIADRWSGYSGPLSLLRERAVFDVAPDNRRWTLGLIAKHWPRDPETLPYLLDRAIHESDPDMLDGILRIIEGGWELDVDRVAMFVGELRANPGSLPNPELNGLVRNAVVCDPSLNRF